MFEELTKLQKYQTPIDKWGYAKKYEKEFTDYYVGISVPDLRKLSKKYYRVINNNNLNLLIHSKINDYRLFALIILNDKIKKASLIEQKKIVEYYLKNIKFVNNWNLVDASAYQILGMYLYNIQDFDLLYEFSNSKDLWIKRISVVATNYLIKQNELSVPLDIIDNLLEDKHDLIHKANGWMLRNIGNKNRELLTEYLFVNYNRIPRTTLRYAIEHYEEKNRKSILKGDFSWR
ncbi:MAG: hypothetical protein B6I17_01975 [Tenericutes bacterium 4572_104]|nr:MAG: hypothetical protein B6I17_01975 [Tenericutes bacterium 4572_104]